MVYHTEFLLTIPGASNVTPSKHISVVTRRWDRLTVKSLNIRRDVVIVCVQSRYLEVLIVVRRVKQIRRLVGCISEPP